MALVAALPGRVLDATLVVPVGAHGTAIIETEANALDAGEIFAAKCEFHGLYFVCSDLSFVILYHFSAYAQEPARGIARAGWCWALEDIDGAGGEEEGEAEGDDGFEHHEYFGALAEREGISGAEGSGGAEGEEEVVGEVEPPAWGGRGELLGELEVSSSIAVEMAQQGTASVDLPIPEGEDQDVEAPERDGGTQEQ